MNHDLRFRIITEGQRSGVSQTCQKYGISRTIYYRWLTRYKENGMPGLINIKKQAVPVNKMSENMSDLILGLIRMFPTFGPRELMYRIHAMGYEWSESAIYQCMRRRNLSTRDKRIKFATRKKPITPTPNVDLQHLLQDDCWLIWITAYGKLAQLGPLYAYTIYDNQTHIACSRLYQNISVACFEDLLTAVAIPVAQSLRLETHHFCYMHDFEMTPSRTTNLLEGITQILSVNNLEGQMHVLTSTKDFPLAYAKRKHYTQRMLSHLLDSLHETLTFDEIKLSFQKFIRAYNLDHKQTYPNGDYTPLEYLHVTKNIDIVLPLWAYLDRPYQEANI